MGFVENVNKVATDLTLTNISNIAAVATNESAINTVANGLANVNTVASNITDVVAIASTVVPNIAEILQADDNAALVAELLDQFDDRYLGSKAAAPLLDNDGNTLLVGALYFDTVTNRMCVWDGALWSDALTLTAGSVSTLVNKTIDDISNKVGANHIHYLVMNVSGSTIAAGTVVTAQGTQNGTDYVQVVPVTNPQTQVALGIMHTTVANNSTGLCMNTGVSADQVDTSGWAVGTILYPNNIGGLTSTKPTSGRYQACAVVLRSHANQGTLLVEFTEPKYIASTTQAGYVQLNNTLTSTSTVQALTAAQGKVLQDGKQPIDATLTALAGVTTSADKYIYATAADTFTTGTITSFGRSLVDDVDAATARGTLGISATNTPSTAVGGISATNVQGALQELDSEKMSTAEYLTAVGTINNPLLYMPLMSDIDLHKGVGTSTFTRASTATYIDRYGVLKSAAIDEPRFEKEGYLNEGSSTNLLTYSEQFDNAIWTKTRTSIAANTTETTDPYGTNLADKLIEDTSATSTHVVGQPFTFVSGTTYTLSFYAKAGSRSVISLSAGNTSTFAANCSFDLTNCLVLTQTLGTGAIESLANGWCRCSVTGIAGASASTQCNIFLGNGVTTSYTGDGTSGLYIFGAQLEALPFASSYIPTVGASVTRSADKLVVTGIGNFPDSQNFTALIDFNSFGFDTATYSPYSRLFEVAVTGGVVGIRASSSGLFYSAHGSTFVYGGFVSNLSGQPSTSKKRFATIANNGLISNAENGVLVTSPSYSNGYAPTGGINIGSDTGTGGMLFGHISNFRIYDKALTAQEVVLA